MWQVDIVMVEVVSNPDPWRVGFWLVPSSCQFVIAVRLWPETVPQTQFEDTLVDVPASYQPVSPLIVEAVPYVTPLPPVTVKKYWVTVVVVTACGDEMLNALRTITVPVVETTLLEPELIL